MTITKKDLPDPEYLKEALETMGATAEETSRALNMVAQLNLQDDSPQVIVIGAGDEGIRGSLAGQQLREELLAGASVDAIIQDSLVKGLEMDSINRMVRPEDIPQLEDLNIPTEEDRRREKQRRKNKFHNQLKKNMRPKKIKVRRQNTRKARRQNRRR